MFTLQMTLAALEAALPYAVRHPYNLSFEQRPPDEHHDKEGCTYFRMLLWAYHTTRHVGVQVLLEVNEAAGTIEVLSYWIHLQESGDERCVEWLHEARTIMIPMLDHNLGQLARGETPTYWSGPPQS